LEAQLYRDSIRAIPLEETTMNEQGISRRELFRRGGGLGTLLALPALLPLEAQARVASADAAGSLAASLPPVANGGSGLRVGPEIYQSIGVRPLINARGTYTIISGSVMLPEVRAAIDAAAQHYVHLDELAEACGARLATLTGAEWGLVTNGCSAAIQHGTAACVAGGNPDLHVRIPHLAGFQKDEVIIPKHSRNVYDAAVRAIGVRVIEVDTPAEFEAAIGPRTAMVYVFAGPRVDAGPLTLKAMAAIAQPKGVPIMVDAAAEVLQVPNVHLAAGATLVTYSGGKCLRGPQQAGMLLGRKDLVHAAWVHSAPHHGPSRALKVSKEQSIGMVMAVEQWVKRDHDTEWKTWSGWLDLVARKMATINGVTTSVMQPEGLSNKTPSLKVVWDRTQFGFSGEYIAKALLDGEPRIAVFSVRGDAPSQTGVSITPYMLLPGEAQIVADKLHAVVSNPPGGKEAMKTPAAPAGDLTGPWDVNIQYAASKSTHTLFLRQKGNDVDGTHQGDFVTRDLSGSIDGDTVKLRSAFTEAHGDSIGFTFSGKLAGDTITGTLDMGEYLTATYTATRRTRTRG
jgi:L-seryl-tRNA(Ser) seleniumtransferase